MAAEPRRRPRIVPMAAVKPVSLPPPQPPPPLLPPARPLTPPVAMSLVNNDEEEEQKNNNKPRSKKRRNKGEDESKLSEKFSKTFENFVEYAASDAYLAELQQRAVGYDREIEKEMEEEKEEEEQEAELPAFAKPNPFMDAIDFDQPVPMEEREAAIDQAEATFQQLTIQRPKYVKLLRRHPAQYLPMDVRIKDARTRLHEAEEQRGRLVDELHKLQKELKNVPIWTAFPLPRSLRDEHKTEENGKGRFEDAYAAYPIVLRQIQVQDERIMTETTRLRHLETEWMVNEEKERLRQSQQRIDAVKAMLTQRPFTDPLVSFTPEETAAAEQKAKEAHDISVYIGSTRAKAGVEAFEDMPYAIRKVRLRLQKAHAKRKQTEAEVARLKASFGPINETSPSTVETEAGRRYRDACSADFNAQLDIKVDSGFLGFLQKAWNSPSWKQRQIREANLSADEKRYAQSLVDMDRYQAIINRSAPRKASPAELAAHWAYVEEAQRWFDRAVRAKEESALAIQPFGVWDPFTAKLDPSITEQTHLAEKQKAQQRFDAYRQQHPSNTSKKLGEFYTIEYIIRFTRIKLAEARKSFRQAVKILAEQSAIQDEPEPQDESQKDRYWLRRQRSNLAYIEARAQYTAARVVIQKKIDILTAAKTAWTSEIAQRQRELDRLRTQPVAIV